MVEESREERKERERRGRTKTRERGKRDDGRERDHLTTIQRCTAMTNLIDSWRLGGARKRAPQKKKKETLGKRRGCFY